MGFMEMLETVSESESLCNGILDRCDAFLEASYNEYKINLKEAKLKVVTENGSDDDLAVLEAAATEGFIVRAKKTIEKIIKTVKEFIENIINQIKKFFTDKKVEKTLDSAEKAVKNNPSLRNKKVTIPDFKKREKVIEKFENKNDRRLSMMKAKQFDKIDMEDINDDIKKYETEKKVATGVGITVGLGAAILAIRSLMKKSKEIDYDIEYFEFGIGTTPDDINKIIGSKKYEANLEKDKAHSIYDSLTKSFKAVASAISGKKSGELGDITEESTSDEDITGKVLTESTIDPEAYISGLLEEIQESVSTETDGDESESLTAEQYLESMESDLFDDSNEDSNTVTAEQYLEAMESELFGESSEDTDVEYVTAEQYLEAMESELFSDDEEVSESVDDAMAELESLLD